MKKPVFLILSGDGINCQRETMMAFDLAGAESKAIHINDLLERPGLLEQFDGMALPGGFSFGDDLGSGQVLALKIKYGLMDQFMRFVQKGKPVIGICNGFQVLLKLGLLPSPASSSTRKVALAPNESGEFINCWTGLEVEPNTVCKWTKGLEKLDQIEFPVRHGEGRIVFKKGEEETVHHDLISKGLVPFRYSSDINGSYGAIAGLCDETGMILGMMPHPEAYLFQATYRKSNLNVHQLGTGQLIFNSIMEFI